MQGENGLDILPLAMIGRDIRSSFFLSHRDHMVYHS